MEVPAAFRDSPKRACRRRKDTYERMKFCREEATDVLEGTYATATKGASDLWPQGNRGGATIPTRRSTSTTDFVKVKSYSELVELSTSHARKQFER